MEVLVTRGWIPLVVKRRTVLSLCYFATPVTEPTRSSQPEGVLMVEDLLLLESFLPFGEALTLDFAVLDRKGLQSVCCNSLQRKDKSPLFHNQMI